MPPRRTKKDLCARELLQPIAYGRRPAVPAVSKQFSMSAYADLSSCMHEFKSVKYFLFYKIKVKKLNLIKWAFKQ